MSADARHPDGLANSSGLVGQNLMFNTYAEVHAVFEHPLNEYKSVQVTRIVHDYYDADPKRGFYGGGGLDGRIGPNPIAWSLFAPPPEKSWGRELKTLLEAMPRAMVVATHGTSLAQESNRVDLDPELKDAWGMPAMRVTYKDHPDDLAFSRFLQDPAVEIMQAAGAQQVWKAPVTDGTGSPHLLGTCRMGNDPRTSVVDRYHRTHDIPNLFVCDGSSFVTSGRGQPTMTIQALAFRAGEHIAGFARRREI
jgi:choline dehydrogenase-like flavoprotein